MTPYHIPTVAETSNMCLWNRTMRVHSELHIGTKVSFVEIVQEKKRI